MRGGTARGGPPQLANLRADKLLAFVPTLAHHSYAQVGFPTTLRRDFLSINPAAESLLKLMGASVGFLWAPVAVAVLKATMRALELPGSDIAGAGAASSLGWLSGPRREEPARLNDAIRSISRRQIKQFEQFDRFEEQVPEDERSIAVDLVQSLITEKPFSYEDLESFDFDANSLVADREPELEERLSGERLSEVGTEFAKGLHSLIIRQIVALASSSPAFGSRLSMETYLLSKNATDRFAESLDQIFLPSTRHGTTAEHAVFQADYLEEVAKRHGRTQLFGLEEVPAALRWSPLDVTYVSLSATPPSAPNVGARGASPIPSSSGMNKPSSPTQSVEEAIASLLNAPDAAGHGLRLVISGTAGTGKTTIVKWLSTRVAISYHNPDALPRMLRSAIGKVPLVVPLRSTITTDEAPVPLDSLVRTVATGVTRPSDWLERNLRSGNAVIFFDGLDELVEVRRANAADWIEQISRLFPRVDIIVTMRPEAVEESLFALGDFRLVTLKAMSLTQSLSIVDRWFDAQCLSIPAITAESYRDRQAELKSRMVSDSTTQELAETPLLAAMLCAYYASSSGEGPRDQRKLVGGVIAALVDGRERARGLIPPEMRNVFLDHKMSLLGQIAAAMFTAGVNSAHSAAGRIGVPANPLEVGGIAVNISMGSCPVPFESVLSHLLERSGLLVRVTESEVQFAHRVFLEFLAAHQLLQTGDRSRLIAAEDHPGWLLVIAHYCWLAPEVEGQRLIEELLHLPEPESSTFARRLDYALADCLSGVINYPEEIRAGVATRLKKRLPPESDEEISLLASLRGATLAMLQDPKSAEEAVAAIATAGRIRTDEALDLVAEIANGPRSSECRLALLDAWRKFPADDYARRVLARIDLSDVVVDVPTASSAAALQHLASVPRVRLGRCDGLESTGFVNGISGCRELDLVDTVDLVDIASLATQVDLLLTPLAGKRQGVRHRSAWPTAWATGATHRRLPTGPLAASPRINERVAGTRVGQGGRARYFRDRRVAYAHVLVRGGELEQPRSLSAEQSVEALGAR